MTTYDDPEPDHLGPAWLVWTLRVAALLLVTPFQLLGVARRLLVVALLRLARAARRLLGPVGRALALGWSVLARWTAAGLRGAGTGIMLLVRAVAWALRRLEAAIHATGPFWHALGRVVARAAATTLPVWRLLGLLIRGLGRAVRPLAVWVAQQIALLARSGVAVARALARPLGVLFSLVGDALGWAGARSWWVLCRLGAGIALLHRVTLRPVLRALGRMARVAGSAVRRSTAPLRRAAAEARASLGVAAASVRRALR